MRREDIVRRVAAALHVQRGHDGLFCPACGDALLVGDILSGRHDMAEDWRFIERDRAAGLALELRRERQRQMDDEGYTPQHDDAEHGRSGLATLAAQYLTDYNRTGQRRRLVQAGALILAALAAHDRDVS